jgi:hypothetical protein
MSNWKPKEMIEKAVVTPNGIKELLKSYDWAKSMLRNFNVPVR